MTLIEFVKVLYFFFMVTELREGEKRHKKKIIFNIDSNIAYILFCTCFTSKTFLRITCFLNNSILLVKKIKLKINFILLNNVTRQLC